jgi:UDP-GlcNAc3NAcA epimerase
LGFETGKFLLTTLHSQENTDDPEILESLICTLNELSKKYKVVLPIHPRTRKIIESRGLKLNFTPIDPVGYFDMIELLKHCAFVISDSGGLQKESFFFEKHCLVIRNETEWTELVEMGYNFLTGTSQSKILETVGKLDAYKVQFNKKPYGNGDAAGLIASHLKKL